MWKLASASGRG